MLHIKARNGDFADEEIWKEISRMLKVKNDNAIEFIC